MARAITRDSDIDTCELTYSELQELWLGCPPGGSNFASPEELHNAWLRGRAVTMRLWGSHGRRPQGWWHLDPEAAGLCYPGYFRERSYLYEHGVLSQQERDLVEAAWKAAFNTARAMSARERREHYEHHDIPSELVEAWTAERRRRAGKRTGAALPGGAGPLIAEAPK